MGQARGIQAIRAVRKFFVDINVFIRYCPRQRINTLIIKTNRLCRTSRLRRAPKMEERDEYSERLAHHDRQPWRGGSACVELAGDGSATVRMGGVENLPGEGACLEASG